MLPPKSRNTWLTWWLKSCRILGYWGNWKKTFLPDLWQISPKKQQVYAYDLKISCSMHWAPRGRVLPFFTDASERITMASEEGPHSWGEASGRIWPLLSWSSRRGWQRWPPSSTDRIDTRIPDRHKNKEDHRDGGEQWWAWEALGIERSDTLQAYLSQISTEIAEFPAHQWNFLASFVDWEFKPLPQFQKIPAPSVSGHFGDLLPIPPRRGGWA